MRLIDADDAVRILACMAEWFPPEDFDRLDFAHDFIESRMTEPVWISVNDHLPNNGTTVLAHNYYGISTMYREGDEWMYDVGFERAPVPDYWMPLPEPPMEAKE